MKNQFKDAMNKMVTDLEKELNLVREDINKSGMEAVSNPQKDTNAVSKKRRHIARIMTAINLKKEEEAFKNTK